MKRWNVAFVLKDKPAPGEDHMTKLEVKRLIIPPLEAGLTIHNITITEDKA